MQKERYEKEISELKLKLGEISHLGSTLALLNWDQEVNMPRKAGASRAQAISYLSGVIHNKFLDLNKKSVLGTLKEAVDKKKIRGNNAIIVVELWRSYERERKLTDSHVRALAELASQAHTAWVKARHENKFSIFLPYLEKLVELKRKEAKLIGYQDSPYDALLDGFEPGLTAKETSRILNELKAFLVLFLAKVRRLNLKSQKNKIHGKFPILEQRKFSELIMTKMGFDPEAGRIDESAHPFTSGFHPHDVRFTTRYYEHNVLESITCTIHETGHALYDQGLPVEHFGTPLAEATSLAIHESQSRLWEIFIGKSSPFWRYFYPKLQKFFPKPFKNIPVSEFNKVLNEINPAFIRTESDEVTYNLHIILRFEIEKMLIEGQIEAKDLPEIWNSKMKSYLGLDVLSDSVGVLQDVHWSHGYFGYFPCYTLGNLYGAQFYYTMRKQIKDIDKKMVKGEFGEIREWLRAHIHVHGKTYMAAEIVKRVTGEKLNPKYFIQYVALKYSKLYKI